MTNYGTVANLMGLPVLGPNTESQEPNLGVSYGLRLFSYPKLWTCIMEIPMNYKGISNVHSLNSEYIWYFFFLLPFPSFFLKKKIKLD